LNHEFHYPGNLKWNPVILTIMDPADPDAAFAIQEIIEAFNSGRLKDEDGCYNIKTMKQMKCLE